MKQTLAVLLCLSLALTAAARPGPKTDNRPWDKSADKKYTARADGNVLGIWDAKTDKRLIAIRGHKANVTAIGFSPDGKLIASADGSGKLCVFEVKTGKQVIAIDIAKDAVGLKWSESGEDLLVTTKAGSHTYDASSGAEKK